MKKILFTVLTGAMILNICGCSSTEVKVVEGSAVTYSQNAQGGYSTQFPAFSTVDMEGNEQTEAIFADADVTVVNFWGTYCNPCINEMPQLQEWYDQLPENVQLIGFVVDCDDPKQSTYANAEAIIEMTGVEYKNLLVCEAMDRFLNEIYAVPTTYFVGADGSILCEPISGAHPELYKARLAECLDNMN